MQDNSGFKKILYGVMFVLLAIIAFGMAWFFIAGGQPGDVGLGWYLFSFAAGLSMIVLPCTLPLAFVIVPLSMGKGPAKGLAIALAFGLGVATTLSMYGIIAALIGKVAIGSLGAPLELVKNWLYFVAGIFAYLFALGELGLVQARMPTYSGAFPPFIQKQQDVLKALLLGLFLGNIGVGCPHPATPMILTRIAVSGDVFYGWFLFFVHAVGRVLPLLFLAILGILGVNALQGLVSHKAKIERITGWGMVFVAAFILVLGLFTHDWWVISGQHTLLEDLTQEERFLGIVSDRLQTSAPHVHGLPPAENTGLFGLPLSWGNWVLLFLWILPLFWYYRKRKKEIMSITEPAQKESEMKTLPYMFWNAVTASLLLVSIFGYALPTRFLHSIASGADHHGGEAMDAGHDHGGAMMNHDDHAGHSSEYHEAGDVMSGPTIEFTASPTLPTETSLSLNAPVAFLLRVIDKPTNAPITNLEIVHEKYLHLLGVREDLEEFIHIHPEPAMDSEGKLIPGTWTINHSFQKAGKYKFYADIKHENVTHSFGFAPIQIEGPTTPNQSQISLGKNVIVGNYQVAVGYAEPLPAESAQTITFDIHDLKGNEVDVEQYLGADMHLTIIKEGWGAYLHTHPEEAGAAAHSHSLLSVPVARADSGHSDSEPHGESTHEPKIAFTATFPTPGIYKMFAQFRPKGGNLPPGEALTASFFVKVDDKNAAPQTARVPVASPILSFLVSVALIAALSLGIKKYITVSKT